MGEWLSSTEFEKLSLVFAMLLSDRFVWLLISINKLDGVYFDVEYEDDNGDKEELTEADDDEEDE